MRRQRDSDEKEGKDKNKKPFVIDFTDERNTQPTNLFPELAVKRMYGKLEPEANPLPPMNIANKESLDVFLRGLYMESGKTKDTEDMCLRASGNGKNCPYVKIEFGSFHESSNCSQVCVLHLHKWMKRLMTEVLDPRQNIYIKEEEYQPQYTLYFVSQFGTPEAEMLYTIGLSCQEGSWVVSILQKITKPQNYRGNKLRESKTVDTFDQAALYVNHALMRTFYNSQTEKEAKRPVLGLQSMYTISIKINLQKLVPVVKLEGDAEQYTVDQIQPEHVRRLVEAATRAELKSDHILLEFN